MSKQRASQNPDELREQLEQIDFGDQTAFLSELRLEARETVDSQAETLADIDTKASKILRLNVLLIGVLVSSLSIAAQSSADGALASFTNAYMKLGVASLILSTALAAVTYTVSELDVGVSSNNLRNLTGADFTVHEAQELLLKNYIVRINFNRSTNVRNIPLITSTILFVVTGIVFLSLGAYKAAIGNVPSWLLGGSLLLLSAIVWTSGLITQARRAIRDSAKWR